MRRNFLGYPNKTKYQPRVTFFDVNWMKETKFTNPNNLLAVYSRGGRGGSSYFGDRVVLR